MTSWRNRARSLLLVLLLGAAGCGESDEPTPTGEPAPTPAISVDQEAEAKRLGVPASLPDRHGHSFVLVPRTEFEMGTGEDRYGVRISIAYYIQTTWVTAEQRRAWRPDAPNGPWTHDDAWAYAAWLTERDDYFRYRLPSEAELVLAGKAGLGLGEVESRATWRRDWFAPLPGYLVGDPMGPFKPTGERVIRGDGPRRGAAPDTASAGLRLVAEVGYGSKTWGVVPVTFQTVDNSSESLVPKPGYALRIISIYDRIVDRALDRPLRWRELGKAPYTMRLVPGHYYVHSYEVKDGREILGRQAKLAFPGSPSVVNIELPDPANTVHR